MPDCLIEQYVRERGVTRCPPRRASAPAITIDVADARIDPEWCASPLAQWFVVNTEPAKEYKISRRLERQGWAVWLPECTVTQQHARFRGFFSRLKGPLFPCYLFVRLDLALAQWRVIEELEGVTRVLRRDDTPAALPNEDVEHLEQLIKGDGGALIIESRKRYAPGDRVRVTEGSFSGFDGLFQSAATKDRINILLDIFGRSTVIAMSEAQVEPA